MMGTVLLRSFVALSLAAPAGAGAGAAAAQAGQAAASSAAPRAPTSKWAVDFDAAQCVASRNYGTGGQPLIFGLKAPAAGEVMQVVVVRPGKGGRYADQLVAKIGIDGRKAIETSMLAMMTGRDNQRLYRTNLPLGEFSAVRDAKTVSIEAGREFRETFAISDMPSLLKVMDECVADLRRVWNVTDVTEVADGTAASPRSPHLREHARGTLENVIKGEDYPGIAMDDLAEGSLRFLVLIDETGNVADCTVTETSGVATLDAQSCAMVKKRAKFKPAIGLDGKPAKDALHQRIHWKIR